MTNRGLPVGLLRGRPAGRTAAPARVAVLVAAALGLAAVGCSNSDSGKGDASVVTEPVSAADRQAIAEVVNGLSASNPAGFVPEVYQQISDPAEVLPAGATVEVLEDTFIVDGDRATVDAVVRVSGSADTRYWLFLERRDGAWLISGTMELGNS